MSSSRSAAGGWFSTTSDTSTRLPADFAIFSPATCTVPTCSHARANGVTPVTASAIAAS